MALQICSLRTATRPLAIEKTLATYAVSLWERRFVFLGHTTHKYMRTGSLVMILSLTMCCFYVWAIQQMIHHFCSRLADCLGLNNDISRISCRFFEPVLDTCSWGLRTCWVINYFSGIWILSYRSVCV